MDLQCNTCKKKSSQVSFQQKLTGEYFKLCDNCREQGRIWNNKRKDKKNAQSKYHYLLNKEDIAKKNKEWRAQNKDKLQAYEKSPGRKENNRKWHKSKKQTDPYRFMFYAAARRARLYNIVFEITKQDVSEAWPIDGKCPMLGIELAINKVSSKDNSASLDRIIPEHGYVRGNIQIISYRANRIKNDATIDELQKIVTFLKSVKCS